MSLQSRIGARESAIDAIRRLRPAELGLGAMLILVLLLAATGCGGEKVSQVREKAKVGVSLERASEAAWSDGMEATAGLQPLRRATPGTVLMGRVSEVLHQEGDRVKAGEILARVESRDVQARLAQAQAAVSAARAQETNARLTLERVQRLHDRNATSQKSVDDANAGYEAAAAGLKAAEEGVEAAKVMVGYSLITAPFSGVVAKRQVEVGDTASPGMPLFVVEETRRMKLEASVPELWLTRLAVGDEVEVEVESASGGKRRGSVAEIMPSVDPQTRTVMVRVLLENEDSALRSGMFARLRIGGASRPALLVSESALVHRGPLTGIFVVNAEEVAHLRWITVGDARDGRVEVLTGLKEGERYVVAAPPELHDGMKVEAR
jgi:RND family efflux transporter MFP subunit